MTEPLYACHSAQSTAHILQCSPNGLVYETLSQKTEGYCWRMYFKTLAVLFLRKVSPAFLPSKKACGTHQFRYWGVRQQYPEGFQGTTKGLRIPNISRLSLL